MKQLYDQTFTVIMNCLKQFIVLPFIKSKKQVCILARQMYPFVFTQSIKSCLHIWYHRAGTYPLFFSTGGPYSGLITVKAWNVSLHKCTAQNSITRYGKVQILCVQNQSWSSSTKPHRQACQKYVGSLTHLIDMNLSLLCLQKSAVARWPTIQLQDIWSHDS